MLESYLFAFHNGQTVLAAEGSQKQLSSSAKKKNVVKHKYKREKLFASGTSG